MSPVRRWTTTSLCLAVVATMSCSWDDILDTCEKLGDFEDAQIVGYMDGVWALATVGGSPIPSTGFAIPGRSDRLRVTERSFDFADGLVGLLILSASDISCQKPPGCNALHATHRQYGRAGLWQW